MYEATVPALTADGMLFGVTHYARYTSKMRRVRELVAAVRQVYPDDLFFDRFWESCQENPAKRKAYRTYDDAFHWLDAESWEVLKTKAIRHFRDHRAGQRKQGFFNQLNESFAYRHLVRQGYKAVRLLPEHGHRVPDLRYFDGPRRQHCEVKTVGISDEEISRRGSSKAFSNVYLRLDEGFLNKLSSTIEAAKAQIEAQGTTGLVYLVVIWDDLALDNYRAYRRELTSFARERGVNGVQIKVGRRFNRRMRLAGAGSRGRLVRG